MTIRTRLSLVMAGILLVSLIFMGGVFYRESLERQAQEAAGEGQDPIGEEILEGVLVYGLPTAGVLALVAWRMTRRALAPLNELAATVERIHANNLNERLPANAGQDEVGRLTTIFNDMMGRLEDSFRRTKDFTLHASHELKTPLAIMQAELETALHAPDTTPAHHELCANQLDEVQRLTHIVEGLTFLAKADARQLSVAEEPVRLDELLRDSLADAEMLARPAQLSVKLSACEEIAVRGDRHRLRQLLLNLADNAIKYNQPGGSVTFSLTRRNGTAELKIANTGPGIPPELLPRVFDRFFRADPARARETEGCGLGLSIAQWIVSAHRGEIAITSEINRETTVTVRLPAA